MLMLRSPLSPADITEEIRSRFNVLDEADALQHPDEITAVATKGDIGLPGELMARLPALRLIAVYGVGVDKIDLEQARARKIAVTTTPGVLTEAVAEHAIALMLSARRRIPEGDRFIRAGKWRAGKLGLSAGISGRTLGILGYGRIGQRIGQMGRALGMKVIYSNLAPVTGEEADFRQTPLALAEEADILIIAAAGGDETRHIVDTHVMKALGSGGLLVNVARGSIVDEESLVTALQSGHLGMAALDVFEAEPTPSPALMELETVVMTPHISSATIDARRAMGRLVIDNIDAFFKGAPLLTPLEF